ncbi:Arylsulfatase A [bacterium A37T11]|nr:Arylsulfatase A [bacterium A37T11]
MIWDDINVEMGVVNRWYTGFLIILSILYITRSLGQEIPDKHADKSPNIIFVLVDDLGYGDVGVFYQNLRRGLNDRGFPFHVTPSLDKMAADGAIFTNQYSNAPVCAPSRASLITGMNQGNAHVRNNQFDKAIEDNYTIANVLKRAGYATAAIGKWGLQGDKYVEPFWPAHPLKRGFDYYYGYMRHSDGHEHYPYEGIYRGKKQVWDGYKEVSAQLQKAYTTDLWTASAKNWIKTHVQKSQRQSPFFLYLAYDCPHAVLELPTQAYPKGGGLDGGIQWLGKSGRVINTAYGVPDSFIHPEYANAVYDDDHDPATPNVPWPDTYKRYATAVRRIDDGIGDLLKLLDDLHIADNTLVVFSSDNGPSIESYLPKDYVPYKPTFFGSYGPFDGIKRDAWEGGLRMPMIARWPAKVNKGTVITKVSSLADWLATFANAAGLPSAARTDSHSLLTALRGEDSLPNYPVYVEYFQEGVTPPFNEFEPSRRNRKRGEMQMVRFGDTVGVRYDIKSADDNFEIYNVANDPKEVNDLSRNTDMSTFQDKLKAFALQSHASDVDAPRPYDGVPIPADNVFGNLLNGAFYTIFNGVQPYLAAENDLKVKRTGSSTTLTTDGLQSEEEVLFEGWIYVRKQGKYDFSLKTTGKSIVKLHHILLLDADYNYHSNQDVTSSIVLQAGYHPIKIYLSKADVKNFSINLLWRLDGEAWHGIISDMFYQPKKVL